jgi:hypothetical protein
VDARRIGLSLMMLGVSSKQLHLVLQLAPRPLESIIDRETNVGVSLITMIDVVNIDLPSIGQREADSDIIRSAETVMAARSRHDHAACRNPAEPLLKSVYAGRGHFLGLRQSLDAMELDLNGGFHRRLQFGRMCFHDQSRFDLDQSCKADFGSILIFIIAAMKAGYMLRGHT